MFDLDRIVQQAGAGVTSLQPGDTVISMPCGKLKKPWKCWNFNNLIYNLIICRQIFTDRPDNYIIFII
jgi:Zn-dependent alcohol dehydrogenase